MDEPIISRAHHQKQGYAAARRGDAADSHNMNPGASAITEWSRGYALWQAEQASHHAPAGAERVDARQAVSNG